MKHSSDLIESAAEIGNEILAECNFDKNGIFWKVHDPYSQYTTSHNLYSGSSGILLFLLELYKKTGNNSIRTAIDDGIMWIKHKIINDAKSNSGNLLSFYSGYGGYIYLLTELEKSFPNKGYKDLALNSYEILGNNKSNTIDCDLLSGTSGEILSLLFLYSVTKIPKLINDIKHRLGYLISQAIVLQNGICWNKTPTSIHPLCGLAHGVSGISFVLFEALKIFDIDDLKEIAVNGFQYENYYYNDAEMNWPDFRINILDEKGVQAALDHYINGNFKFFTTPAYWSGWCHGAPGIGMSRLRAYLITKNESCLKDFENAIDNYFNKYRLTVGIHSNYTLCHGILGVGNLLIDGYLYNGSSIFYKEAEALAKCSINSKNTLGFHYSGYPTIKLPADSGLFMGKAGIGHYYLRLSDPVHVKSILLPEIEVQDNNINEKINVDINIEQILLKSTYPSVNIEWNHSKNITLSSDHGKSLYDKLYEIAKNSSQAHLKMQYFKLDIYRHQILESVTSDTLLYIHNVNKLNNKFDANNKILVDKYLHINRIEHDKEVSYYAVMPIANSNGIISFEIGQFVFDLLMTFIGPATLEESFNNLLTQYEFNNENEMNDFKILYLEQFNKCYSHGFFQKL